MTLEKMSLKILERRDDGKYEILDVKLDNRKTKSLDPNNKISKNQKIDIVSQTKKADEKNRKYY